jgi:Skp family chaperone for outer membrane proteins
MSTVQEIKDAFQALSDTVDAERAEVVGFLTGLKAEIQALKDQIAAGSPATQADLDDIKALVDSESARVQGIVTAEDVA